MKYIEFYISKILLFFGYKYNTSLIPKNTHYCYTIPNEELKQNKTSYNINPCPFFLNFGEGICGCKFCGVKDDILINDQVKICGVNTPER